MTRHTAFKFCLDPTIEQREILARHAGAGRFAFNQCLRIVKAALTDRRTDTDVLVPWTGFDLINAFNSWKTTEAAGRVIAVDTDGVGAVEVTGLVWRTEVCQQVFEEAAVDCGRALSAWSASRAGMREGKRVGFPRFHKKAATVASFRLRNRHPKVGRPPIRIGDNDRPRSVTLPGIGLIGVHDDTRSLRRMLAKGGARILFATVSHRGGRWWVSLNVAAADLHPTHRHSLRDEGDPGGWVGVDLGLAAFVVAATSDGHEVARVGDKPKALANGMARQRRLAKSLSRKQKGSHNRRDALARLGRHHHRVANVRAHFLHQVSNTLVKTHDRLVLEDLNVSGMLRNRRLARAISDASWAEFVRMIRYKQAWRHGAVATADRWYPSSQLCSICGARNTALKLADRVYTCPHAHAVDRDLNAAANLARWAEDREPCTDPRTPKQRGRATNARRREALTGTLRVSVKPARLTREPTFTPLPRPERGTPEKGGAEQ
jgi:putative transposase